MKQCRKCLKMLDDAKFYHHKTRKDGLTSYCRACNAINCKSYVARNREKKTAYQREWNAKNREKVNRQHREWRAKNWDKHQAMTDRWAERNPDGTLAHRLVRDAERKGEIVAPEVCECGCGSDRNILAHHEDYSKPFDIIWLSAVCHYQLHANRKAAGLE